MFNSGFSLRIKRGNTVFPAPYIVLLTEKSAYSKMENVRSLLQGLSLVQPWLRVNSRSQSFLHNLLTSASLQATSSGNSNRNHPLSLKNPASC